MDYGVLRKRMVEEQLLARGIKDPGVLAAFAKIERHRFVPENLKANAYADYPLSIGEGQTISQPYMAALMTEALGLSGNERVLEIGMGSGYQAAVLAELAKEVYTMERLASLLKKGEALLSSLGYANIRVREDDGTLGWPEEAPFDRIIVTAASPKIPAPLIEQLGESGKLILPVGEIISQVLTLVEKKDSQIQRIPLCSCVFVPLVGKYGWFCEDVQPHNQLG